MAQHGYYSSEQLMDMFSQGKITKAEYIMGMSSDIRGRYRKFCASKDMDVSSKEAADAFMDLLIQEEQRNLDAPGPEMNVRDENRQDNVVDEDNYAAQIFKKWNNDPEKIQSMLNSLEAGPIAKWRFLHPLDTDMEKCALETSNDLSVVQEWWDIPDYILGANDGYPVSMIDYNIESIESVIKNSVPKNLR